MIEKNLEEYKGIAIYAQQVDGKLSNIALELLGKHLGIFTDKIEANVNDTAKNELAELLAQRKARGEPDASK